MDLVACYISTELNLNLLKFSTKTNNDPVLKRNEHNLLVPTLAT